MLCKRALQSLLSKGSRRFMSEAQLDVLFYLSSLLSLLEDIFCLIYTIFN